MLKELRQYFGLSQQAMAEFMGISRSQLALVETDRRWLKSKKMLPLYKFYMELIQKPDEPSAPNPLLDKIIDTQQAKRQQSLDWQFHICRYRLTKIQRILTGLLNDRARATLILEKTDSLLAIAVTPLEKSLLELIVIENEELRERSGEDAELPLRLKICALEAQLAYLQQQMGS